MPKVPNSFNTIQQPSIQYNKPVSEASMAAMGGAINGLLSVVLPVGTIVSSMLTEIQFQTQIGNPDPESWILADGRDVSGSLYAEVSGQTLAPDLRGITVRGKNGTRSDGKQNPDGDLALGTYTASRNASHNHGVTDPGHSHNRRQGGFGGDNRTSGPSWGTNGDGVYGDIAVTTSTTGISINNQGGGDASPANVTINYFIRIN